MRAAVQQRLFQQVHTVVNNIEREVRHFLVWPPLKEFEEVTEVLDGHAFSHETHRSEKMHLAAIVERPVRQCCSVWLYIGRNKHEARSTYWPQSVKSLRL